MARTNAALALAILALLIAASPWIGSRWDAARSRLSGNPIRPTFVQLEATPERFDGALVFVVGFCVVGFEHVAIYRDLPDANSGRQPAFWLDLKEGQLGYPEDSSPRRCRAKGVFKEGPAGHMSAFAGEFSPVMEADFYPASPDAA